MFYVKITITKPTHKPTTTIKKTNFHKITECYIIVMCIFRMHVLNQYTKSKKKKRFSLTKKYKP